MTSPSPLVLDETRPFSFFGRQGDAPPSPVVGVEPGRVIGDFRLTKPIGQGGMGQVWEAEQISLGRRVALKLVRPDRLSQKTLELFGREARAGGRLQHAGIVGVHGHGESDGVAWIALELVEGSWTLRDFLNRMAKHVDLPGDYYDQVARLMFRVADALHVAHEAGVIHRDLKPQNVLITRDQQPKVTDFGLARITDETALSETGDFAGTYCYMSPEQVAARRMGIDHRSDVFSLGVVLYEMLALRRPFEGDTSHQVAQQILVKDPPELTNIRSRIPRELAVITGKALEKDRDRRYQSMAQLAADIRRYMSNEPIRAKPPGRLRKLQLWAHRHPTKSVAAMLTAVAFALISLLLVDNVRARSDLAKEVASVKRLSALQDYEDLVAVADKLWPPRPENIAAYSAWIGEARDLVDSLPFHRANRDELRSRALKQTDEEREAERLSHPDFPRIALLEAEMSSKRTALLQRRDGVAAELPELDWSVLPVDPSVLNNLAWDLVDPDRPISGRAGEGLVIARRALALAQDSNEEHLLAQIGDTVSRALYALGRDAEAIEASRAALLAAPEGSENVFRRHLADLEKWVAEATSSAGLTRAEQELKRLEAECAEVEARVAMRHDWQFPKGEGETRWWHNQLTKLIEELEAFADDATGLMGHGTSSEHGWGMSRRLVFAERMRDGFAPGGEYHELWAEAIRAIRVHPDYGERVLAPQMGLVPVGRDPETKLWEFWHVATGERPERGENGELSLTEETGLILVLIPGGTFSMGALDAPANEYELPVHEVTISPFFLSKYEMTQGQWKRFAGWNRSLYGPDGQWTVDLSADGHEASSTHPVEQVSWEDCKRELERMGLSLPSEAQWEYGARAGTETPWCTGPLKKSLQGAANLADAYAKETDPSSDWSFEDWLDDGFFVHGPVGSHAANGFGLHDVHGNVWEWCLDGYERYSPDSQEDPVAPYADAAYRVYRGGCFRNDAKRARSAYRNYYPPSYATNGIGVRPARVIEIEKLGR